MKFLVPVGYLNCKHNKKYMSSFSKALAPELKAAILAEFKGTEVTELERTLSVVFAVEVEAAPEAPAPTE